MANDATRGVGNSSAQTVDDHVLVNGRTRKRSAAGGWSEAEVCAEEVADPRKPMWHHWKRLPIRGSRCVCSVEDLAALLGYSAGCCRCEVLEQTHKKRMTIAVTPIPKKSTEYQPSG